MSKRPSLTDEVVSYLTAHKTGAQRVDAALLEKEFPPFGPLDKSPPTIRIERWAQANGLLAVKSETPPTCYIIKRKE